MKKFLSILMLACLLCGMALPVAAEGETACTKTAGCTLEDGHDGDCFVPCTKTEGCTKADGHEGLCDALCDDTAGCLLYGSHEGDCVTELELAENDNINEVLASRNALISYLEGKYHGYRYEGGSITLKLSAPGGGYGDVTVQAELEDGILTLQGVSGTKMNSLTIKSDNVCVEKITFAREGDNNNNISIKIEEECSTNFSISDCTFTGKGYDFRLTQNQNQYVPSISMEGNSFSGGVVKVVLRNNEKKILGYWNVTTAANPTDVSLTLNAAVENAVDEFNKKYTEIQYSDVNIRSLTEAGWKFYFIPNVTFSTAYAAHEGEQIVGTQFAKYNDNGNYKLLLNDNGKYVVVGDDAPNLKNSKVVISKSQAKHLSKATVKCKYKAASVTFNNKTVPSSMSSDEYLTFTLNTPSGNGTYVIKETTKTVTKNPQKTTNSSRKYSSTSQDYFLVTPAGFSNAVRYVKDNLVTIDCTQAGRKSISLPVASMAAAAEKGYDVLVKTKYAEMTLDAAALKSLSQQAKGTTVLLHYQSLNHKTLTSVGQASLESHLAQNPNDCADLAFLVTATSDSETIEDLQRGTITLKIPFIVLPGTEDMENVVYALQGETVADARETTVADGYLTVKLLDLTEHMVFQTGEPVETTEQTTEAAEETAVETTVETTQETTLPETEAYTEDYGFEEEEADDSFPIWIPVVVVLLLAGGGAAAWFLYFRKRLKK